jgi:predicted metal-dependent phosphoesterase TrpH
MTILSTVSLTRTDLIDHAAAHGFDALAVTLHDRQLNLRPHLDYARERGITLIPGVERTIEGRHVLLLNFARGTDFVRTFADLRALRRRQPGLVVAPHPFFPDKKCLWGKLERHADLFDAVERNAMFLRGVDFNLRAERWAARQLGRCTAATTPSRAAGDDVLARGRRRDRTPSARDRRRARAGRQPAARVSQAARILGLCRQAP